MKLTATQLRRIIKEEVSTMMGGKDSQRFLHGFESGHPHDDEGYMAKSRMASLKKMAAELCDLLEEGDQLPGWVQDHIAVSHENLQQVHGYLMSDEAMRSHQKVSQQVMPEGVRRQNRLAESHSRITEEEFAAWKSGDWGFVSEHDGGGPRKYRSAIPTDPRSLMDYIVRNYEGMCVDLGCSDVSDPEFKDYVSDQLADKVDPTTLQRALEML